MSSGLLLCSQKNSEKSSFSLHRIALRAELYFWSASSLFPCISSFECEAERIGPGVLNLCTDYTIYYSLESLINFQDAKCSAGEVGR